MGYVGFWQPFWVRRQRMAGVMKPRVERCEISAVMRSDHTFYFRTSFMLEISKPPFEFSSPFSRNDKLNTFTLCPKYFLPDTSVSAVGTATTRWVGQAKGRQASRAFSLRLSPNTHPFSQAAYFTSKTYGNPSSFVCLPAPSPDLIYIFPEPICGSQSPSLHLTSRLTRNTQLS